MNCNYVDKLHLFEKKNLSFLYRTPFNNSVFKSKDKEATDFALLPQRSCIELTVHINLNIQ